MFLQNEFVYLEVVDKKQQKTHASFMWNNTNNLLNDYEFSVWKK